MIMKRLRKQLSLLILPTLLFGGEYTAFAADFEAKLDWAGLYIVSFPLDGRIARVHVNAGDRVGKGALLVELNTEPIDISVKQYEAEMAARQPVLADAKRDFEHAQSLYEQTVLSDVELQRARHAFEKATAELTAARARLQYARWQKRQARVSAPWEAWVIERNVEPGQMLVAEQRARPVLILARAGQMTARAELPLSAIQALETGQPLTVLINNRAFSATVTATGMHTGTENAGSYMLEAVFDVDPKGSNRAGQAAVIRVP
jgi:RND family efflux transporter MFP subunit